MKKIRCAIAGLGRIGCELENDPKREKPATHAGAVNDHPDTIICAGADTDPEKRNNFTLNWGVQNVYESLNELLSNEPVDIVQIATPPETHLQLVKTAVDYSVPVIILEKPVASTLDEARQIVTIEKNSKSKIVINHERRYSLQYRHVKHQIESGQIGALYSINAKLCIGSKRTVADMLYDDGTHMIDLLSHLTGEALVPYNVNLAHNQTVAFVYGKCGDTPVTLEVGAGRDHLIFELDFSFSNGRIRVGNGYFEEYCSQVSPFYSNYRSLVKNNTHFPKTEYFKLMFKEAVDIYKNEKEYTVSSTEDGLSAITVIDQILNW